MQEQLQKQKEMHRRTALQCMKCKLCDTFHYSLQMHQPTPAYCHGDEEIVCDVWFEHSHQLPVQVDGFRCHPEEHNQEEVVHERRDHPTEHRNTRGDCADDERDIQPHQSKAEVEQ